MGLPNVHRVKRREDFTLLYQKGKRFKTEHLTLRALRRLPENRGSSQTVTQPDEQLPTRIGIVVSVKVDKRSVVRNRIKRRIQGIFQQFLPRVSPGWDVIVIVHPQAVQCDYIQFLQELEQLLKDAEVLNGVKRGSVL